MRHAIPRHFFLDAPECCTNRRDLRDDIDAVAVLVDHFRQAADLAFDPAQAFLAGCLDVFSHSVYIPLQGMGCKMARWRTRWPWSKTQRQAAPLQRVPAAAAAEVTITPATAMATITPTTQRPCAIPSA